MSDLPVLLSTRQAAERVGVTIRTIQRLADADVLAPAYKLAGTRGAYLFRETDVDALIGRRERAA